MPYLKLVRARIEKNRESPAWSHLEGRWRALADHAGSVLASHQQGRPGASYERRAAEELMKLVRAVDAREASETALAMFVMQELEPRRFRSDLGFRMQLVRRIRGLTDLNAGEYYDPTMGRTKRVYTDLRPRAAVVMGRWLAEAFGAAGVHLGRLEQRDIEARSQERLALRDALQGLT